MVKIALNINTIITEMPKQADMKRIVDLLTMPAKKMKKLDEEQLNETIAEVNQIKVISVKEGRFLG